MKPFASSAAVLEDEAGETTPLLAEALARRQEHRYSDASSQESRSEASSQRSEEEQLSPRASGPSPPGEVSAKRHHHHGRHRFWPYAAVLCGALSLVADLGDGLTAAPEVRLLEMAVCRDYYRTRDPSVIGPPPLNYVREELCKRDEIQVELAYLRALKSLFAAIPGMSCILSWRRLGCCLFIPVLAGCLCGPVRTNEWGFMRVWSRAMTDSCLQVFFVPSYSGDLRICGAVSLFCCSA